MPVASCCYVGGFVLLCRWLRAVMSVAAPIVFTVGWTSRLALHGAVRSPVSGALYPTWQFLPQEHGHILSDRSTRAPTQCVEGTRGAWTFFHPLKINLGIVKRYSGTMAQPAWKRPKHALKISPCGIWLYHSAECPLSALKVDSQTAGKCIHPIS